MRVILHLDLDCFYAQVEAVRLGIPDGEPVAVQQWGSLLAVNYAARPYGVSRSDYIADARKKCPHIHLPHVETIGEGSVPPPGADLTKNPHFDRSRQKAVLRRYRLASREIFRILAKHAPVYERASIDEAFLDVTDQATARLAAFQASKPEVAYCDDPRNADVQVIGVNGSVFPLTEDEELLCIGATIAQEIRREVLATLHYTCSVGVASNKLVAKLASPMNKPNGQTVIPDRSIAHFMQTFPVDKVRGLGGKLGQRMAPDADRIFAGDLLNAYGLDGLQRELGHDVGAFVFNVCSGSDGNEPVNDKKVVAQHVSAMKSFNQVGPVLSLDRVKYWITILCEEVVLRHDEEEVVENHRTPTQFALSYQRQNDKPMQKKFPAPPKIDVASMTQAIFPLLEHATIVPCMHLAVVARDFIPVVEKNATITHFFKTAPVAPEAPMVVRPQKEPPANLPKEPAPASIKRFFSASASKALYTTAPPVVVKPPTIARFFEAKTSVVDGRFCDRCHAVVTTPWQEHDDYHVAMDLQQSYRAPPAKKPRKGGPMDAFVRK
ncbi:hypothetical protein SPRG_19302 [Saprolegnia parasitica CBS 223.65]|uniref:UmuC domain-containing protein n=1 Tax=Saprolegnia parasitica (strain CBS 223.65) TaxID=695850 RepID=A0A067CWU5_SAPPC|nr:hypothetical protein SPRG_19302 [Saprolegnia parasitica CBS 223.65]KDO33690.1 hypothetical protein SPRG_19302 [Saprolegnia parasitica CBS 223.65]|eukprot:XP_012195714.1 hypothetical protein SPRG_19302 [Saprolegnia parasitica CBS 223.65]